MHVFEIALLHLPRNSTTKYLWRQLSLTPWGLSVSVSCLQGYHVHCLFVLIKLRLTDCPKHCWLRKLFVNNHRNVCTEEGLVNT